MNIWSLRKFCRVPCFALLLYSATLLTAQADTIETAKVLASTRFKDWTYGTKASNKQIDCVYFVLAVAEEELKTTLPADVKKAILLSYGWSPTEVQTIAVSGTDPKLGGVHHGLVDLAKRAVSVNADSAKVGDFIQYWMKKADGTWFGHSGIISNIKNGNARVFSANISANGIADSTFELQLTGDNRRIFIARLKE